MIFITSIREMVWAEWASTITSLLRSRSNDQWSMLYNEMLDRRIKDVLRMYGVDSIHLDSLV